MVKKYLLLLSCGIFLTGCVSSLTNQLPEHNEIVMTEGMSITSENLLYGTITITAGKGLERSYTWEGGTRSLVMWPRKERWHGSLGIYYPGPGNHWKEHDGITRAVADEGRLNFSSLDTLFEYIKSYNKLGAITYNDDGLFVCWEKNPGAGGTLQVIVRQLLIDGQPPNKIPGSQNDKISVAK